MGDTAIRVSGLGKRYRIGTARRPGDGLRELLTDGVQQFGRRLRGRAAPRPATEEDFWAVKDVSFEVKRGECVGIIGRNGAGKSTLLKMLSRITEPTEGEIGLRGRVGSLLEVGTGFHPELTGRENIFLNGSVLGMSRREVQAKFDEIVAFSEVERFLDTPVKRYSSGMYVRLAFAVAAHLEPEILIVDEVLAVGDAEFQRKCLGKMGDFGQSGRTVLFVSHSMNAVQALCDRAVSLHRGRISADGPVASVVPAYLMLTATGSQFRRATASNLSLWIEAVEVQVQYACGRPRLHTVIDVAALTPQRVSLDMRLTDSLGIPVGYATVGGFSRSLEVEVPVGGCRVTAVHDIGALANGVYRMSVDAAKTTITYLDRVEQAVMFEVSRRPADDGEYRTMEQGWGFGSVEFRRLDHTLEPASRGGA